MSFHDTRGNLSDELHLEVLQPEIFWLHQILTATRHEFQPANLLVPRLEALLRCQHLKVSPQLVARQLPPNHCHLASSAIGRLPGLRSDIDAAFRNLT